MRKLTSLTITTVLCLMLINSSFGQKEQKYFKEFDAKPNLEIKTISGDCMIQTGPVNKIVVEVTYSVRPTDAFKPEIREREKSLKISEKWTGRSSSGNVSWTITLPPDTKVDFSTASGELSISGLTNSVKANTASGDIQIEDSRGEFDISTASGSIEAEDIKGEIELNTASGNISIKNAEGEFDLSCASGDIDARKIIIKEASSFSTASGDVDVVLATTPDDDCDLSAASGDVTLDFDGNEVKGYLELSARKRNGKIRSDIAFDKEEEYEQGDRTYIRKSLTKGSKSPEILMSTSSGKVTLKK